MREVHSGPELMMQQTMHNITLKAGPSENHHTPWFGC